MTSGRQIEMADSQTEARIMNKAWAEKNNATKAQDYKAKEENFASRNANGTGPFTLVGWQPDTKTTLKKNPNWWDKPKGNIDEVVFTPIKSAATRSAALISGQVDFVVDPPPQDLARMKADSNLKLIEGAENRTIFIALDEGGFPTGELRTVDGSALDFRAARSVAAGLVLEDEQVRRANGFDHHFVLNRQGTAERLAFAARAYHPASGRQLEVWSSEPGMQFFTGNNLAGKLPVDAGKDGKAFVFRGGFCMEPSRFPDSPNHPELPSTSVKPGEFYTGCIEYRFSAR